VQWSLFLHKHARRLNVAFFGRLYHEYLTPFVNQKILIITEGKI
jgi:hypothetical protein